MTLKTNLRRRAYTLVELLTVIAITAILLGIIILPVIQAFNLTRQAETFGNVQDRARVLSERISREIGQAAAVRDNEGVAGTLLVRLPIPANGEGGIPTGAGTTRAFPLAYAKLDLIPPSEGDPTNPQLDPNTGKIDPTLQAPKGQINFPLAPGQKLVRYFVGLRDPFSPYNNPYDGILMDRRGGRDNLYVLYRAEVVPSARYFAIQNNQFVYDDPAFFLCDLNANGTPITTGAKADRVRNWLARSVVVTEVSRFDQVQPEYDIRSRLVRLDANGYPRLLPLVQFRPERVSNDPTEAEVAVPFGSETEGASLIGPETYTTKFGAWSNGLVRINPRPYDSNPQVYRYIARPFTGNAGDRRTGVFAVSTLTTNLSDTDPTNGTLLFDITRYNEAKGVRAFPYSEALFFGGSATAPVAVRNSFVPFITSPEKGLVRTSFSITEVGPVNASGVSAPTNNTGLPAVLGGDPTVPANDPTTATGVFSDRTTINQKFNKVWNDALNNQNGVPVLFAERGTNHRFIDLRVTPNGDGLASPLHPDPSIGFARTRIVPGSEEVFGPDATPGPNYGQETLYHRTTRDVPGPNEYRINYVDQPEPASYATVWGTTEPPVAYSATNFVSAVIQPRYKAGYLQLCSEPNIPLPNGPIRVSYRFQMNGSQDVVSVDYSTRSLISVLLTIRAFAQSNLPTPPSVSLKATATARNLLR
ncbi:MAG: hypothetical protein C4320_00880 [Armatimonadota bacterium]